MTLYELYAQKVDSCTGWPKGEERIKIFISKKNAMLYKIRWEKRWEYDCRNCIYERNPDVMATKGKLILKKVETDD